jgi:hypothetical protein
MNCRCMFIFIVRKGFTKISCIAGRAMLTSHECAETHRSDIEDDDLQ